jgi:hypothetical protein
MPIPANCHPDNAKDATLTVYNPTTHEVWTTWRTSTPAQNAPGCTTTLPWGDHCYGDGRWHFYGGGVIRDITKNPGYFDYASVPGFSTTTWGTSATSTVNAARTVLVSEVLNGYIPHAVAVASSAALNCQFYDRWPSQRNDGNNTAAPPTCIPEGTFFRIDPTVNLQALNLPKFTLMVAQAAQRYGLCVCESTGGGPSLQVEDSTQYGFDAWDSSTLLYGQFRYTAMRAFPWALLQAIAAPTRFHTATQVASTTSSAPARGAARSPVTVNVAVASADGHAVPGAVYLSDAGGAQVASAMLSGASPAHAALTFTPWTPGTCTYTVSYGGDQTVKPSTATVTVTVIAAHTAIASRAFKRSKHHNKTKVRKRRHRTTARPVTRRRPSHHARTRHARGWTRRKTHAADPRVSLTVRRHLQ